MNDIDKPQSETKVVTEIKKPRIRWVIGIWMFISVPFALKQNLAPMIIAFTQDTELAYNVSSISLLSVFLMIYGLEKMNLKINFFSAIILVVISLFSSVHIILSYIYADPDIKYVVFNILVVITPSLLIAWYLTKRKTRKLVSEYHKQLRLKNAC